MLFWGEHITSVQVDKFSKPLQPARGQNQLVSKRLITNTRNARRKDGLAKSVRTRKRNIIDTSNYPVLPVAIYESVLPGHSGKSVQLARVCNVYHVTKPELIGIFISAADITDVIVLHVECSYVCQWVIRLCCIRRMIFSCNRVSWGKIKKEGISKYDRRMWSPEINPLRQVPQGR